MAHSAIPNPPYAGGCLCGAVRYSINARPIALNACHCTDCHKLSGATNLLMIMAPSDAFKHERGETHKWRKRADSGREVDIVRCATCGVRLWHELLAAPQFTAIAAGTLDDPSWVVATSHIWTSRALPAAVIPEDVYTCPVQPVERSEMSDAFNKAHPS